MNDGTRTSSPAPTPSARSAIVSASVPLATPTTWRHAQVRGQLALERLDLRPEDVRPALEHRGSALAQLREQGLERRSCVEQRDGHGGPKPYAQVPFRWRPLPFLAAVEPVVLASITDSLANFATNVVGDLGLPGIFVLMLLESACIPIPSEATMLFAGFNVHDGEYSLFAITVAGVLANLVGSWIAYAVGYYGRIELIEQHGNKLHIKQVAPRLGRPLVRALRRRDGLLHPHAADHPHVHLAARRRGPDAVLALHGPHPGRLRALGVPARRSSASRRATTGTSGRTASTTSTMRWPR